MVFVNGGLANGNIGLSRTVARQNTCSHCGKTFKVHKTLRNRKRKETLVSNGGLAIMETFWSQQESRQTSLGDKNEYVFYCFGKTVQIPQTLRNHKRKAHKT